MEVDCPWTKDVSGSDDDQPADQLTGQALPADDDTPTLPAVDYLAQENYAEDDADTASDDDDQGRPTPIVGRGKGPYLLAQGRGKRPPPPTLQSPPRQRRRATQEATAPHYAPPVHRPHRRSFVRLPSDQRRQAAINALTSNVPVGTTVNLDGWAFRRVDNDALKAAAEGYVFRCSKSPELEQPLSSWEGCFIFLLFFRLIIVFFFYYYTLPSLLLRLFFSNTTQATALSPLPVVLLLRVSVDFSLHSVNQPHALPAT
mgnify:CR=1 FL=1